MPSNPPRLHLDVWAAGCTQSKAVAKPDVPQAIFKQQSQKPFSQQDSRLSVDAGPFMFHYLTEEGVCYLVLADKGYPKKLAYQYLEELQRECSRLYGPQINTAARPYAFIKFGRFL